MTDPIVITRDTVSRPWTEVEPKIFIALVTGFLAVVALIVAKGMGFQLPDELRSVIPLTFALLCGYFTKSSGTTVTRYDANRRVTVESHSAPTVTTVTGPTPIQRPAPAPAPAPAVTNDRDSVTRVLSDPPLPETPDMPETPDELPTAVLAPRSQNFLNSRFGQTVTDEGGH